MEMDWQMIESWLNKEHVILNQFTGFSVATKSLKVEQRRKSTIRWTMKSDWLFQCRKHCPSIGLMMDQVTSDEGPTTIARFEPDKAVNVWFTPRPMRGTAINARIPIGFGVL